MQEKETINDAGSENPLNLSAKGRLIALDPGTKRIGVAVSDEDRIICRPLPIIKRSSWKTLVAEVRAVLTEFDAKGLVIGLPLESDGSESEMSREARDMARKFQLTFEIPVFLQDERVTTYEAKGRLWHLGQNPQHVDSEAAAIILSDFLGDRSKRDL